MTDPLKRAAGLLRGLKEDIEAVQQSVSTSEGKPNLLRSADETATGDDSLTVTTETVNRFTYDQDAYDDTSVEYG